MAVSTPRLRGPQEVADQLGVSAVTVRRWIHEGRLEAVRLGDTPRPHLRVSDEALERFLQPTHEMTEITR